MSKNKELASHSRAPYTFQLFINNAHTRSFSSSHPRPPAPTTKILQVSNINCNDCNERLQRCHIFEQDKMAHSRSTLNECNKTVTSVLGSKSGCVKGPGLSRNFLTWFHRPSHSRAPPLPPSTTILKTKTLIFSNVISSI